MVTRPEHQADHFCKLLAYNNIHALRFPTLEIVKTTSSRLADITAETFDAVIFISANAVAYADDLLTQGICAKPCKIAAIGKKTQHALLSKGYAVDLIGKKPFNSEAFLSLPSMQNIEDQRILIIKGRGGRKKLEKSLKARGAIVDTCDVYERKPAAHAVKYVKSICNDSRIDIIAITSFDSANYLVDFFRDCEVFTQKPLLVGSQRIASALTDMNIANPLVIATNPSDECMLETLLQWIPDR